MQHLDISNSHLRGEKLKRGILLTTIATNFHVSMSQIMDSKGSVLLTNTMDLQASSKKKRAQKLENVKSELDLIIAKPKKANKHELYLFSSELLSFEKIVSSAKRNLHTLVVIRQSGITSLNGISVLNNLRELWVVECHLKDLLDLQDCSKLETLYLYSNRIDQVPNMSKSPDLKLLSLSGNSISQLQNLDSMPNLEEFYIANNRIKKVGNAFSRNSHLFLINLAGNPLYELKDIQNLLFISSLRSIILSDPLYGECPLVSLCNYRHFTINYLTSLTELDYYPISDEERSYVTELFKSKMMFYNMLSNKYENQFLKLLKDRRIESRKRITEYRNEIYLAKLDQLKIAASKDIGRMRSAEFSLREMLRRVNHRIDVHNASDKQWIESSNINLQILQRQLSLKVQHCENMDFIEYMPGSGNALLKICQDICSESLCQTVKDDLGITSVRLNRVTKVINNESDAFRSFMHHSEGTSQDQTESDSVFKFLVRPVGVVDLHEWPFDIFEEEFIDATDITTTDCLAAADADWMKTFSSERKTSTLSHAHSEQRLAILVQIPVSAATIRVQNPDDYHAMHPAYNRDTCQCFCVTKPDQVKPVFAVEYEYIFQNKPEKDNSDRKFRSKIATETPFNALPHLNLESLGLCLDLAELEVHKLRVIDLSGRGIRTIDLTTSLPSLRELNLSFNKLTALPDSTMLKYVKILDVSFNDIQEFDITTPLPLLENFNAAWNLMTEFLEILQTLGSFTPNLTTLDLKHNPFTDVIGIESMLFLACNAMPLLKSLDETTINNSICRRPVNRYPWAIEIFEKADSAKLKIARNSTTIAISETNKSLMSPLSIDERELKSVQYINLSNNYLNRVEFMIEFPGLKELYLESNLFVKIFIEKPVNQLTRLSLMNNFITTLDGLTQENFPALNYLNLCNNLITSLLAMGTFRTLTQFYCSHNRISELQEMHNLRNWQGLKFIDISNNLIDSVNMPNKFIIFHISKIEYVGGECVTPSDILEANQMFGGSLDKDMIMNMRSLGNLTHLKQLSIANCGIKQVELTADLLPNLKSLDLGQNQIRSLWGLHTLKKLQVLCLSYNQVETSVSNDRKDFDSTECLFHSLNTLFLDYNGIRSLVDLELQNMPVLKYLYLQHNELRDVNGLQKCANLETLVLDHNKIQMITEENFHTDNNIKALFLENNRIYFLSFARSLSKIKKLFLSNNKITDKDQLKYLTELEYLKEITIRGNPLCKRTNHYEVATQTLITLTRVDGRSVI